MSNDVSLDINQESNPVQTVAPGSSLMSIVNMVSSQEHL